MSKMRRWRGLSIGMTVATSMTFTKSTRREKSFFERDKSVCRVVVNFAHDHRTPARSSADEATFMRSTRMREREDDTETTLELSLEERCDPTEH
jgi:hypothetical protein